MQNTLKIAKSAGFILISVLFASFLGFLIRWLIIQNYSSADYGVFSLALSILGIFAILGKLGLHEGVPRQIGNYLGKNKNEYAVGVVYSSLIITLLATIIFSLLFYLLIPNISNLFNEPRFLMFLPPLVFYLIFYFICSFIASFLRGFEYSLPRIMYSFLQNSIAIVCLAILIFLNLEFLYVSWVWSISMFLVFIFFIILFYSKIKEKLSKKYVLSVKELLFFSLPLLILGFTTLILTHTDTIVLGIFFPSNIVGIYNTAVPLAKFIPIFLAASTWLYLPITSKLWVQNKKEDMKKIYSTLTKWIVSITLPLFLILFLFPSVVLRVLFGNEYVLAATSLSILSIGFFFHILMGPNDAGLIAIGENKKVALLRGFAAVLNLFLNFLLIPYLGMTGAAIASTSSWILSNILISIKLYRKTKIHPFTIDLVKPLIVSIGIIAVIYFIAKQITFSLIGLGILGFIFIISYVFAILITKSFNKEDIELFLLIENKIGINFKLIKKIISKFV